MTAPTQDRPRVRPPIDPRIRDRRIEVIREAGRRRLRVTLVIASTIVVVGLAYLGLRSPLLDLDHIQVTGTRRETPAEILTAARVRKGDSLPFMNTRAVARRIERLPWVASARVRRDLPSTLRIAVTEYVPTAYVRITPHRVALVASTGRVIARAGAAPPNAVQVVGEPSVPAVGASLSVPDAANIVAGLPLRLGVQVRAINIGASTVTLDLRMPASTNGGECATRTDGSGAEQVQLGTLDDLANKGAAALAVLDHLGGQSFTYIDVAAPQAPVSC